MSSGDPRLGSNQASFDEIDAVRSAVDGAPSSLWRQSDDQMKVFDGLHEAQVTLLDLPAGSMSMTPKRRDAKDVGKISPLGRRTKWPTPES